MTLRPNTNPLVSLSTRLRSRMLPPRMLPSRMLPFRMLPSLYSRLAGLALLFILLTAFTGRARAQFNASLAGSVVDSTGAAIPNATVVLTNLDNQQTQTKTTGGSGAYRFNELAPGPYSLAVDAKGFQHQSFDSITLAAETPRDIDVKLQPGQASQSVTVNASDTPLLQTGDASIGTTIDSASIQRLPTSGSDPYELLRTAPGITGDGARGGNGGSLSLPNGAGPGQSNSGIFQTENQVQISADGQRTADNNFMLDGVSVNSLTHGGAAVVTPNEEAIAQMTVVSTSFDAADGRNSGAQIKVVTKSGTNQLHGSLFFLYNEPGLNAFNKYGGPAGALPARVQNKGRTYAASLGGPIIKDKLFLFTSYEGFTLATNGFTTSYVETPAYRAAVLAQRGGSVSAKILADPGATPRILKILTPSCAGFTSTNCNVVSGGLDIGSLTPGGTSQIGVFPSNLAIGGGLDGIADVENAQLFVPSHSRGNQFNGRADWYVTPRDQFAASVYFTKLDSYGTSGAAGSRPQGDLPFKPLNSAATAIYIHTFGPAIVNELRGNVTRFAENGLKDSGLVNFGIPYVNVQTLPFPIQFGASPSSTTPAIFAENTYEFRDLLTHTWGAHTLKLGGEVRLEQDNDNLLGNQRPIFAMQGLWALANDAAIFEAVTANPNTGGTPLTQRYFRSEDYALYAQHDWKVNPNLTLNMGLRWEEFTPLRNKGFKISYPTLGPGPTNQLTNITLTPHNHLWNFQHNNYAPKFGFAYTPPRFNSKMVVRGGFAMAYNHLDVALFNNAGEDGPNIANFGLCCAGNTNKAGVQYSVGTSNSPSSFPSNPALKTGVNAAGFPNPIGGGTPSVEIYGALPNTKNPLSYLYSFETQYQLPYQLTATIGYQGSTGHHYARLVNQDFLYNQVNAPVYAAYFAQTDSTQNYNALNLQLVRQLQKGFTFTAFYTYSKAMDQVSNGDLADSNANQTNPANNVSEYGPSDYNTTHRVTATALYQLPRLNSSNGFVKAVVNGWQVNGLATYHTGFPWTPVTYNLQANALIPGANLVSPTRPVAYYGGAGRSCSNDAFKSGSNFPNRTPISGTTPPGGANYFNINSPKTNGAYVPGIGRNSFAGPCYADVDMSFAKETGFSALDHTMMLRFQANAYNVFNMLQLQPLTNGNSNQGANIQSQYFGYAQGADAGRVIEFLVRLQF